MLENYVSPLPRGNGGSLLPFMETVMAMMSMPGPVGGMVHGLFTQCSPFPLGQDACPHVPSAQWVGPAAELPLGHGPPPPCRGPPPCHVLLHGEPTADRPQQCPGSRAGMSRAPEVRAYSSSHSPRTASAQCTVGTRKCFREQREGKGAKRQANS